MSFSDDGLSPEPTAAASDPPQVYSNPTHSDLAAVAATVSVVGVFMALLIVWLIFRLRRVPQPESEDSPARSPKASRPSFAPSEASSKFAFIRKPLRLSHRQQNASWDFADPDPFSRPKENPKPSQKKHRPSPLSPTPAYTSGGNYFGSKHNDDKSPRTPTTPGTPASVDFVDPPPPAYCPDGVSWTLYHPKDLPPLSPK